MLATIRDFIRPVTNGLLIGLIILGAVAVGIAEATSPGSGVAFTKGAGAFLHMIPEGYYQLAGLGLASYTAGRTVEKIKASSAVPNRAEDGEE